MPKTPSGPLSQTVTTRGLSRTKPHAASSRATQGYFTSPAEQEIVSIPTPLSSSAVDLNGIQRLLSNNVQSIRFVEVYRSEFAHPSRDYTGYGADGFWYDNGVLDPSHIPFKASWSQEGESDPSINRGDLDEFPRRMFVVATVGEVCLFNADDLTVWMRFTRGDVIPSLRGPFLGGVNTTIRGADFINGFLVVATDTGLRIANFRKDVAYLYGSADSFVSEAALSERNSATFMDGVTIAHPTRILGDDDCLDISVGMLSTPVGSQKQGRTVCALARAEGLTGIVLAGPSVTLPACRNFTISKTYVAAWSIDDDGDGDSSSPYFVDSGSNWVNDRVHAGDVLVTDLPSTHTITEVAQTSLGSKLILDPPLALSASGASYTISRGTRAVHVDLDGSLYFVQGQNQVTKDSTTDWFLGTNPLFSNLASTKDTASLAASVEQANDIAASAGSFYVATSKGVFYGTDEDLAAGSLLEYRYSTEEVSDVVATYRILQGAGESVSAVAIDPETGGIMISVDLRDGDVIVGSVVNEVNPNIHQMFRYFDQIGIVRDICTYRNADGPPDVEVP